SGADIFAKASQFPAPEAGDLPVSADAREFYKSGRPFFQRYLPFRLAQLACRLLIVLVPLVGIVYPLLRFAPALYGWSMRRRIFQLYGELKLIEADLEVHPADVAALQRRLGHLHRRSRSSGRAPGRRACCLGRVRYGTVARSPEDSDAHDEIPKRTDAS